LGEADAGHKDVLEMIEQFSPRIVLVDVNMPLFNGLDPLPSRQPEIRARLEREIADGGTASLAATLGGGLILSFSGSARSRSTITCTSRLSPPINAPP
jgi:hypothetical protein